jgi:hypothetical protein
MTRSYTLWIEERNYRQVTVTADSEDEAFDLVDDRPSLYWAKGIESGLTEYIVDERVEQSDAR